MNKWGEKSLDLINKKGFNEQLKRYLIFAECMLPNATITDTVRTAEEQQVYFKRGTSKIDGINKISEHQKGNAFDIVPYPSLWNATSREWITLYNALMIALHEFNKTEEKPLKLSWGGLWNDSKDKIGWDCPHFECQGDR